MSNPKRAVSKKRAAARHRRPPPVRNYLAAAVAGNPDVLRELAEIAKHPGGVMGYYSEQAVRHAREGDTDAAREILDDFIATVADREKPWDGPLRYCYAQYLAQAFQRILAGEKADLALGIKTTKRGPKDPQQTMEKYEAIAASHELLKRGGLNEGRATSALEQEGFSKRTIQRAREHYPWMDAPERYNDELLKGMASRYAPKIARILGAHKK